MNLNLEIKVRVKKIERTNCHPTVGSIILPYPVPG